MFVLLSLAAVAAAFKSPVNVEKRDFPAVVCDDTTMPLQIRLAYAGTHGKCIFC
jgi:hypothetical protein